MWRFIARRALISLGTLLGVIVVVFAIVRVLPGDGAVLRAGPYASDEKIAQIREKFGYDDPMIVQFGHYLSDLTRGDLGTSIRTEAPVREELLDRLPATLELAVYSVGLAVVVGVPLGMLAAVRRGTWVDGLVRTFAVIGSAMALFWLGLLVIYVFFFRLGWAPGPLDRLSTKVKPPGRITGFYTIDGLLRGQFATAWDAFRHLWLPVGTLGFVLAAPIIKMVRAAMIDQLESAHVRTARALGVPSRELLGRDAFRNALLPVTTSIGIVFGYLLGGNIIIEHLFAWPGVGRYAFVATQNNDIDALQGFVIVVGVLYIALNLVIDLAYARIDPRIRVGRAS